MFGWDTAGRRGDGHGGALAGHGQVGRIDVVNGRGTGTEWLVAAGRFFRRLVSS